MEKNKVAKEDVQKKVVCTINKDTRRYTKGQEIELTPEMVKIYKGKGLIGNEPPVETEEQKEKRQENERLEAEKLKEDTVLILNIIKDNPSSDKKKIVELAKFDKKRTDKIVKSLVKESQIEMSKDNKYSIKE